MRKTLLMIGILASLTLTAGCGDADKGDDDDDDGGSDTDADGDGFAGGDDCDDSDPAVNPDATEVCDGIDNNCDGEADENGTEDGVVYYVDGDGDGYGVDGDGVTSCNPIEGYSAVTGDCDDADYHYNPAALEDDCDDPNDYNCDGSTGFADADSDGFPACRDCDDTEAATNPAAAEVCDDTDNDCDGDVDENATDASTWYADADGDSYGNDAVTVDECDQPLGYVSQGGDCDDVWAAAYPGGTEVCDGHDNDCDGDTDGEDAADPTMWYGDSDSDGYGDAASTQLACDQPSDYVDNDADCDDSDGSIHPDGTEVCDGDDNDCDGQVDGDDATDASTYYIDSDGDGQGSDTETMAACSEPSGYSANDLDCNDGSAAAFVGATEYCDTLDNDCDGTVDEDDAADATTWYADSDSDGAGDEWSTDTACDQPRGYVANGLDCDDDDASQLECDWSGTVTLTPCSTTSYQGPDSSACVSEYSGDEWAGDVSASAGLQTVTFPDSGWYAITAAGAQGGTGSSTYSGGLGAEIYGEFYFDAGDQIVVAVGQEGSSVSSNGGGGGGTWVIDSAGSPQIVAGGGGGIRASASHDGCGGRTGTYAGLGSGGTSSSSCAAKTTLEGYGGEITSTSAYGAGGGGLYGDGEDDVTSSTVWGYGGSGWSAGLEGGQDGGICSSASHGGFGGGGAGAGCNGGGGGGGYSGGDGGWIAGGGGSYNAGDNPTATDDTNSGDGWVTLEHL
jgi:hypothetical protein